MMRFSYWNTGSEVNPFVGYSYFMNAYFPGINNVCVIWRVRVPNKIVTFYYDLQCIENDSSDRMKSQTPEYK